MTRIKNALLCLEQLKAVTFFGGGKKGAVLIKQYRNYHNSILSQKIKPFNTHYKTLTMHAKSAAT